MRKLNLQMNQKQHKILTLTLNPSTDQIQTVDPFLPFGKNIVLTSDRFLGGKGINVSLTLGNLGADCVALGFAGEDTLPGYEEKLKSLSVEPRLIPIQGKTRENLKIVDLRTGKDTEFNQFGFQVNSNHLALLNSFLEAYLPIADWLILSGSLPPGVPSDYYFDLVSLAKSKGVRTCLDTSGSPLIEGFSAQPDILRINLSEMRELVQASLEEESELVREIARVQKKGVQYLVISLGSQGAIGFNGHEMLKVRTPVISPLSLTGAGDAMTGAFVFQLQQGKSFREVLAFSAAVASASVLCKEPGDFRQQDAERLNSEIQVEKL